MIARSVSRLVGRYPADTQDRVVGWIVLGLAIPMALVTVVLYLAALVLGTWRLIEFVGGL